MVPVMTDQPITLDGRRGMAAQKATEIRRLLAEVEANEQSLRSRQEELELQLIAVPAVTWFEAAQKARYLLGLFAVHGGRAGPPPKDIDRERSRGLRPLVRLIERRARQGCMRHP